MSMLKTRKIIIGLDGAPFHLLKDLSEKDVMPNTSALIQSSVFKQMTSSIPEISSVAWSSIITGKNPGEHGIFGFIDIPPGSYNISFPNYNNLQSMPFWCTNDSRSVIINVPSTFPAKKFNGALISGFVSPNIENAVYPESLLPLLKDIDYRIDVDSSLAHRSMDLFLTDLDKTLDTRIEAYRILWEREDWDTFMLVFTGTDRLMHFLWDAYEDENHALHAYFLNYFKKIDAAIGEIVSRIRDEDILIMLSDHGFERLEKDININYLLRQEGFLKLQDSPDVDWSDIDSSSSAFALDPSRIYINLKSKYPRGKVKEKNRDKVIRQLYDLFGLLMLDGMPVIKSIYSKEELYHGNLLDMAPDIVLISNHGFNLKAKINAEKLSDKDIFTGKHVQDNAFLLVRDFSGSHNISDNPTIFDIRGLIENTI